MSVAFDIDAGGASGGRVMRVLVCGGRYFNDQSLLNRTLDRFAKTNVVDAIAASFASEAVRKRLRRLAFSPNPSGFISAPERILGKVGW